MPFYSFFLIRTHKKENSDMDKSEFSLYIKYVNVNYFTTVVPRANAFSPLPVVLNTSAFAEMLSR